MYLLSEMKTSTKNKIREFSLPFSDTGQIMIGKSRLVNHQTQESW